MRTTKPFQARPFSLALITSASALAVIIAIQPVLAGALDGESIGGGIGGAVGAGLGGAGGAAVGGPTGGAIGTGLGSQAGREIGERVGKQLGDTDWSGVPDDSQYDAMGNYGGGSSGPGGRGRDAGDHH
ncbi:bacteriocin [Phyllobacterium brassicacearum]|uniref:Bacteriocin n=1 Tax=Phyllobacterium brassicacearum TaxID=314235 RepID=A0A2P7BUH6_9HYPH|nr:bacteriocin [Phyllobacterium brassicacearum]PSH70117.1 bacteriocin [Phyllobacterium brassicacearum]